MILLFSWIHAIGHLSASFVSLSRVPLEEVNEVLMYKKFTSKPTYAELLFTTTPGITGIMLLIVVNLISFSSLDRC